MSSDRLQPHGGSLNSRAGSASVALGEGVVHLDAKAAAFKAMTDGWTAQMLSRGLKRDTIESRLSLVRRFAA